MRRIPDNLPTLLPHPRRCEEWAGILASWLKAEEDEGEARKWEGWMLDEANRQKLPRNDTLRFRDGE